MGCYCGSERSYEECCKPYHDGTARPETAEALMRSRYSAYVVQNIDYVLATHDPGTVDEVDREGATKWSQEAAWEGLEIVNTEKGGPGDDEGVVEFIARYGAEGHSFGHHERSTFRRIEGNWYYMDGDMVKPKPVVREGPKVGRNDPCPCGSGQKYKKCHGR
jgi:SEC-C motif-containing protein